ncbi:MAG TPA: hypothetical protein VGL81_37050 [Polyangiaceae bacterium]|jgi:hypothetical protein
MNLGAGPRFDESLASAAHDLHVGQLTLGAIVVAVTLYARLERRSREQWKVVPATEHVAPRTPYRSGTLRYERMAQAPRLVRLTALATFSFVLLFAPLVLLTLLKYPFDGVAIPLVPGLALAILNGACAVLLLWRSKLAVAAVRSGAVGSLMINVGLLVIGAVHLCVVELDRHDGIEHACSSSVTFMALVFAVCSIVLALLMKATLRAHEASIAWTPSRLEPLRRRCEAASAGESHDDAAWVHSSVSDISSPSQ